MITKIAKDKLLHFIAGTYIVLIGMIFMSPIMALIPLVVIGAGKEIFYDKLLERGTPESMDFAYTLAGGVFTFLIHII